MLTPDFSLRQCLAATCLCAALCASMTGADAQTGPRPDMAASISKRLDAFCRDAKTDRRPLRVVYFHPADTAPLPDYELRLTRILLDIREFYRSEMEENGFGSKTFGLEMQDEKLTLHVVKGKRNASDYSHESGNAVRQEIQEAVAGTFRISEEHVLVVNAMCRRNDDGSYFFHAPYYGSGGTRSGLCHVADCEFMDTRNFLNVADRIQYEEHNGVRNQSLADFSCLYIGGIAHELGHAFGYQHNRQKPWERQQRGTALMGAGNFTYRHELRGTRGSFLTFATSMQLASHPLFTGVRHGLDMDMGTNITELTFFARDRWLVARGKLESNADPYAVVAFTNPKIEKGWYNQDYDALTWNSEVTDGRFEVAAKISPPGRSGLKLRILHLNGMQSSFKFEYGVSKEGIPSVEALNNDWRLQQVERAYLAGKHEEVVRLAAGSEDLVDDIAAKKLQHIQALVKERAIRDLDQITDDSVYLSEVDWTVAQVGWGKPARDQYYSDQFIRDSVFLELGGEFHARGLYAHAPSRYQFKTAGQWKKLTAVAGLQKEAGDTASGIFRVLGDGKVLYASGLLKGNETETLQVDVSGIQSLDLVVESGKQGNGRCWTIWGSAKLSR